MNAKRYRIISLLAALAILAQGFAPIPALAEVTMRCVDAPAAAPPCMRTMMAVVADGPSSHRVSMACCHDMAMHMRTGQARGERRPFTDRPYPSIAAAISAPRCLVSVNPLASTRAATITRARCWLLDAAPALAPPHAQPRDDAQLYGVLSPRPRSSALSSPALTLSRALRAPPVS